MYRVYYSRLVLSINNKTYSYYLLNEQLTTTSVKRDARADEWLNRPTRVLKSSSECLTDNNNRRRTCEQHVLWRISCAKFCFYSVETCRAYDRRVVPSFGHCNKIQRLRSCMCNEGFVFFYYFLKKSPHQTGIERTKDRIEGWIRGHYTTCTYNNMTGRPHKSHTRGKR